MMHRTFNTYIRLFVVCVLISFSVDAVAYAQTETAGEIPYVPGQAAAHRTDAITYFPVIPSSGTHEETSADQSQAWSVQQLDRHQDTLTIISGNSRVMRFDRNLKRVAISNPAVADITLITSNEVLINTKKKGAANLILWDDKNDVMIYSLTVTDDPTPLKNAIHGIDPNTHVNVFPTERGFVVSGEVDSVSAQKKISDAAKAFSDNSVSLVSVNKAKQILLEIRFMEVDRSTGLVFGVDGAYIAEKAGFYFLPGGTPLSVLGGSDNATKVLDSLFSFPGIGVPEEGSDSAFTAVTQDNKKITATMIDALEDKAKVKVLARPNLLVRDGEEGSFLVGGEFPVPIVTDDSILIQYREFGTRLTYKPEVTESGTIRLGLQTEVSQLDFANGIQVNGFEIPTINARRTATNVELKDGQSLVIGGLIQQKKKETESGTPFIRKIPLFGRLFERTENDYEEIELIVIVTPSIVDPDVDAFDLDTLPADHELQIAIQSDDPPFGDEQAQAIENTLKRFKEKQQQMDLAVQGASQEERKQELLKEYYARKQAQESQDNSNHGESTDELPSDQITSS